MARKKIKPKSDKRIAAFEKRLKALELRREGWLYSEIAKEVGYSRPSGAYNAVRIAMREALREPADDVRRLEEQRLDKLFRAYWQKAVAGDAHAADYILKLMGRRAKLVGLDAPQKVAPTNPDGTEPYTGDDGPLLAALLRAAADIAAAGDPAQPDPRPEDAA